MKQPDYHPVERKEFFCPAGSKIAAFEKKAGTDCSFLKTTGKQGSWFQEIVGFLVRISDMECHSNWSAYQASTEV